MHENDQWRLLETGPKHILFLSGSGNLKITSEQVNGGPNQPAVIQNLKGNNFMGTVKNYFDSC